MFALQCYIVTGDAWTTARIVAEQLGINNVMAEVLPAGKAEKVVLHPCLGCFDAWICLPGIIGYQCSMLAFKLKSCGSFLLQVCICSPEINPNIS